MLPNYHCTVVVKNYKYISDKKEKIKANIVCVKEIS